MCEGLWPNELILAVQFERYSGILGGQPTNNCAIEPQLLKQFVEENLNLQLLATANVSSDAGQTFGPVVKEHALGFYSLKHLDTQFSEAQSESSDSHFVLASKYTVGVFQEHQLSSLTLYSSQETTKRLKQKPCINA